MIAAQPTAPAPKTARVAAGLGTQRVEDGAGAGLDAAAERRQRRERRVGGHLDEAALVDERVPRERGLAEEVAVDGLVRRG